MSCGLLRGEEPMNPFPEEDVPGQENTQIISYLRGGSSFSPEGRQCPPWERLSLLPFFFTGRKEKKEWRNAKEEAKGGKGTWFRLNPATVLYVHGRP